MLISSTRRQAGDAPLVLYVNQLLPSTLRWVPLALMSLPSPSAFSACGCDVDNTCSSKHFKIQANNIYYRSSAETKVSFERTGGRPWT